MPDLHIRRDHALGLPQARALALKWAETAQARLDMACTYEEGPAGDRVGFTRSGVNGELHVTAERFELHARLGFLLGAFKSRIVAEIEKNLDELLAQPDPLSAFDEGVAQATAKAAAKKAARTAAPRGSARGRKA